MYVFFFFVRFLQVVPRHAEVFPREDVNLVRERKKESTVFFECKVLLVPADLSLCLALFQASPDHTLLYLMALASQEHLVSHFSPGPRIESVDPPSRIIELLLLPESFCRDEAHRYAC